MIVICHTPGCGNAGIPLDLDLTWVDEEGTTHRADTVVCGVCGQEITDHTQPEAQPDEPGQPEETGT